MAEFFTHNAPDYGEEDTLTGSPGTPIADKFRRLAPALSLQEKKLFSGSLAHADPVDSGRGHDCQATSKLRVKPASEI